MTPPNSAPLGPLERLGFTPLEAIVYREVLRRPDHSGYAIAKAIGRPEGNTYNVLAALTDRGALIGSETRPRTFRATPPRQLLQRIREEFTTRCEAAEVELAALEAPVPEGGMYRLTTREQVYDRAQAMLQAATATVVYEAFPAPFSMLAEALSAAAARLGQAVAGLLVAPAPDMAAANARLSRQAPHVRALLTTQSLTLITDAACVLQAVFSADGERLVRATWLDDVYLAYITHSAIVSDIVLHTSPLIDEIRSPNMHLLGRLPPSIEAVTREA